MTHPSAIPGSSRKRFHARFRDQKGWEFINGQMVRHSPVTFGHANAASNLALVLEAYVQRHALGHVSHGTLLVSLTRNDYEPDICFWHSGKSLTFKPKQMKFPAPDLVVEVLSPSTLQADRSVKFEDYAAHAVEEYWIVDPDQRTIEQYLLAGDAYELAAKKKAGTLQCRAIKGLKIPVLAAFDARANLQALQAILKG